MRAAPWAFEVRLYRNLAEIVNGYTKNLYEGMGRRAAIGVGAVLFVMVGTLFPYVLAVGGAAARLWAGWGAPAWGWILWAALICAVQVAFRARIERFDGRSPHIAWVHPRREHPAGVDFAPLRLRRPRAVEGPRVRRRQGELSPRASAQRHQPFSPQAAGSSAASTPASAPHGSRRARSAGRARSPRQGPPARTVWPGARRVGATIRSPSVGTAVAAVGAPQPGWGMERKRPAAASKRCQSTPRQAGRLRPTAPRSSTLSAAASSTSTASGAAPRAGVTAVEPNSKTTAGHPKRRIGAPRSTREPIAVGGAPPARRRNERSQGRNRARLARSRWRIR
jgi:hypothetical protein